MQKQPNGSGAKLPQTLDPTAGTKPAEQVSTSTANLLQSCRNRIDERAAKVALISCKCSATKDPLPKTLMKQHLLIAQATWLIVATSVAAPVSAQTISEAQMRAANLARMQAELINGGLRKYSPAQCMHQGGGGSCLMSKTAEGYRFRFLGGPPGWAAKKQRATIETVVFVSPDGRTLRMEYNGPVKGKAQGKS